MIRFLSIEIPPTTKSQTDLGILTDRMISVLRSSYRSPSIALTSDAHGFHNQIPATTQGVGTLPIRHPPRIAHCRWYPPRRHSSGESPQCWIVRSGGPQFTWKAQESLTNKFTAYFAPHTWIGSTAYEEFEYTTHHNNGAMVILPESRRRNTSFVGIHMVKSSVKVRKLVD